MVFRYGNEPLKLWDSNLLICSSSFMYLDSKSCRKEFKPIIFLRWKQETKELIVDKIKR